MSTVLEAGRALTVGAVRRGEGLPVACVQRVPDSDTSGGRTGVPPPHLELLHREATAAFCAAPGPSIEIQ